MRLRNKQKILHLVSATILIFSISFRPLKTESTVQRPTIRVGYFLSELYQVISADGSRSGYGYEYLQRIADYTYWKYDFVDCTWGECLNKLENGEIDLMTFADYSPERDKIFDYSKHSFGYDYGALSVRKDNAKYSFNDFESFNGMKVAVQKGSSRYDYLLDYAKENNFSPIVIEYPGIYSMEDALEAGEVDAIAISEQMNPSDVKIVARFGYSPYYVIVKEGNSELLDQVDQAIESIGLDDPLFQNHLFEKYYGSKESITIALSKEEKAYLSEHGVFRVAAPSNRYPLSAYDADQGTYIGFENVLLARIAENIGIKLEYVNTSSYLDRIDKVQRQKADIMVDLSFDSGLSENSNIRKTIPYMEMQYTSITRNNFDGEDPTVIVHPSIRYAVQNVEKKYDPAKILTCNAISNCIEAVKEGKQDITYISIYEAQRLLNEKGNKELVSTLSSGFSVPICFGVDGDENPLLIDILNKEIKSFGSEQVSDIIARETIRNQNPATVSEFLSRYPEIFIFLGLIGLIILLHILNERRKAARLLFDMAYVDEITHLKNLRWLEKEGRGIIRSNKQRKYAILAIDIDRFDVINDCYGRIIGDDIICHIASVLEKEADYGVISVRVKADHFISLIPYKDTETLDRDLLYLYHNCSAYKKGDTSITLHMNFGAYLIPDNDLEITAAIDRAEIARKETKNSSSHVVFYNDAIQEKLNIEKTLEDLQVLALRNHEFEVYFQPKYNMKSGSVIGAEALIRWRNKEKGFMLPEMFIPLFERNGFILQLDDFVLEEICKMLQRRSISGQKIVPISVNQSRIHLAEEHYIEKLQKLLEIYKIPKYMIELELTETALAETENAQATLVKMKEIGYLTSIDDFGSGYSSLTLLNSTQIDILKLDRKFLSETYISKRTKDILTHIVAMAHSLNIQVICEGVETKEQSDFLMSAGCLYAQGFYYSKPVSQKEFEEELGAAATSTNEWIYGYYQTIESDIDSGSDHTAIRNMFESFLSTMYTERNPEKTLSFMASDIYIYDPSSPGGVLTKKEFGEKLYDDLDNNLMPYDYEIERFSQKTNPDGSQEVFAILSLHQTHITTDSNVSRISLSASIACILEKCFIETLHISYITDTDGNQQINVFLNEKTSYDLLNEKFPGCVIGFYIEPEYPLFFFNPQLLKLFDFSIDEFREFSSSGIVNLIYQEDRENFYQTIIQTPENSEYELDLRCVKKDGSLFWVSCRGRRIMAKDGRTATLVVLIDITERKNAQEALEFEKNRYQLLVECTDATIFEYDNVKDLMLINYKMETPDGLKPGIMTIPDFCRDIHQNQLIHEEDRDQLAFHLQNGRKESKIELRLTDFHLSGGEYLWYRMNNTVLYDEDGVPIRSLGLLTNIDAEKKKISRLTFEARRDSLTGLYNKASLEYLVREAIRNHGPDAMHAFMIMDMDNFKKVNDECGHPYGDIILRGLSEVLKKTFRSDDILARIGGDEFVVFIKNIKSKDQLQEKTAIFFDLLKSDFFTSYIRKNGRSLCHLASTGMKCEDCKFTFSCSIGISIFNEDGEDFESLYRAADIALYQAKGSGNFRFVFHTPDMETGRDKDRFHTIIDSGD